MNLLTIDQILGKDDREYKDVEVPEWGGSVRLRAMSSKARDAYEARIYMSRQKDGDEGAMDNVRASLVAQCMCDEEGNNLKLGKKQVEALGGQSAAVVNRLFDVARKLNGISDSDVEELEKN